MCLRYHIHLLQTIFFSLKNLNASLISLRAFAHALPLVFLANHITDLPNCKLWIRNIHRNISDACSTLFFCNKPCVLIICQYIYKGLHLLTSYCYCPYPLWNKKRGHRKRRPHLNITLLLCAWRMFPYDNSSNCQESDDHLLSEEVRHGTSLSQAYR